MIDEHQRIAASRMVYYLVLGIVSMAFVIPYFASLTIGHGDIKASMMATVVLNLSGLMSGLLHLFLRSNTATTAFGPKNGRQWNKAKHQIRMWGPNELAFGTQLFDPVPGPRTPVRDLESRADSRASLVEPEKGRIINLDPLSSPSFSPPRYNKLVSNPNAVEQMAIMPTVPEQIAEPASATRGHARKQSYSLFPPEMTSPTKGAQQNARPAESIYDISNLAPPPPIFGLGVSRHRRDSSIASSATVQIGLRLSHAPTSSLEDASTLALPQTTYSALPSTTFNANAAKPTTSIPLSTFNAHTPSPLKVQTQNFTTLEPPLRSPRRPSPLKMSVIPPAQSSPVPASINKLLPPTPKPLTSVIRKSNTILSPTVYSPQKKIPAPSPVVSTRQSTTYPVDPLQNMSNGSGSPVKVVRSNSNKEPPNSQTKSDWI
ncbi:hypothetical protein D0Z07_5228 [Hyphodiscus hymeniophilus]|uniref:Uncharacterized protein n=1 Tax=Hyphodiscus hymeniophilus TaxID=353542 RepID=A0A9P6VIV2_9HELO|nr:hypothetical protein D0Z07_5228 [Hyphodiscus hymeniophilus]